MRLRHSSQRPPSTATGHTKMNSSPFNPEFVSTQISDVSIQKFFQKSRDELLSAEGRDAVDHEDDNATFPDVSSGGGLFNDERGVTIMRTHQLNAEMSECINCTTRSLENQMCYGRDPTPAPPPEYIDISDCSMVPEVSAAAEDGDSVELCEESKLRKPLCWCNFEVYVFSTTIYVFKFEIILS